MRRTLFALLIVLVATAGLAEASTQAERTRDVPYDVSAPGPFASARLPTPAGDLRMGGTSIELEPNETTVEVFLLDVTHLKVPGRLVFYDGGGAQISIEEFCFTTNHGIPNGAVRVSVHPSPLALVPPNLGPTCPVKGANYGPATRGEILFHLS